jgi:hypothetical protein
MYRKIRPDSSGKPMPVENYFFWWWQGDQRKLLPVTRKGFETKYNNVPFNWSFIVRDVHATKPYLLSPVIWADTKNLCCYLLKKQLQTVHL